MKARVIKGGEFKDERGTLQFFNDFDATPVKRMYMTTHTDTAIVRAWQGHKIEQRWLVCTQGSFTVKVLPYRGSKTNPQELQTFILEEKNAKVLHIPGGYLNGFQALVPDSKLLLMADYKLNALQDDLLRFDKNTWGIWEHL